MKPEPKKAPPKTPPKKEYEKAPAGLQDVLDEKLRKKEEAAPTTKTEMGTVFKKGGVMKPKKMQMGGLGRAPVRAMPVPVRAPIAAGAVPVMRQPVFVKKGGKVGSASKRADGIAKKGKTRGRMV